MRSSIQFYDAVSDRYDDLFEVPHRRAYDELTWEYVEPLLPATGGCVIDAGCGNARWSARLIERGHHVIGIEQSPGMAAKARSRFRSDRFQLFEGSMEEIDLPERQADIVLALGSLQYTHYTERMVERFANWARPGGMVIVLVDSLVALLLELLAAGKDEEAFRRVETRRATWIFGEQQTDYHLLDRERLECSFRNAGLIDIRSHGLLVGMSMLGREQLIERLTSDWEGQMRLERRLADNPVLADLGKQLLVIGRRPGRQLAHPVEK